MNTYTVKRTIIGRLDNGADLYESFTRIAQEKRITVGRVTGEGTIEEYSGPEIARDFDEQTGLFFRDITTGL